MTMVSPSDLKKHFGRIRTETLGLYVHVPFCRARCRFCALYMERHRESRVRLFLRALERELRLYAHGAGLREIPVHTIYLGGGTPTTLTPRQLLRVLDAIREAFVVDDEAEVSVEVHPGTVTREGFETLRQGGVTRLSVGGQSFDPKELLTLGGRAFGAETRHAVRWARSVGFSNISLDLMFGFPGQSEASWQRTLDEAIALSSAHLSCYAYTLEEGSPFHREFLRGCGEEPDQALQATLEDMAAERLSAAGFTRYEISNYCRPYRECRHNMRYWRGQAYLGLGPSAQSYLGRIRFGNVADGERYADSIGEGLLPLDEFASLSFEQRDRERVVMGLRLLSGVPTGPVFTGDARTARGRTIHRLRADGLLIEEQGTLRLTKRGIRHADTVAVALW